MQDKVPSFVSENEQRRLTLAGRFAMSASALQDEQIAWLLKNENQGEIPILLSLAAELGRDQRIALKESAKTDSPLITIPSELAHREEKFWKDEYGVKADFAGLPIPRQPFGYKARFGLMHEKASQSSEFLFASDKKTYGGKVWKFTEQSLDDIEMTHQFTGTFGSWVADEQEAPDGCIGGINLNTAAVDELNRITPGSWSTETLPMRQVHGRAYWREHQVHLDHSVVTFCQASRLPGGSVPRVFFCRSGGKVYVYAGDPQDASGGVRFRRAVLYLKPL